EAEQQILALQRTLEDKQRIARTVLAKMNENQLVQLWNEINDVVQRTAKTNYFNIVLAYGEPTGEETKGMAAVANINRKLQALEMGSTMPLHFDGSVDITEVVVMTLNNAFDRARQAAPAQP